MRWPRVIRHEHTQSRERRNEIRHLGRFDSERAFGWQHARETARQSTFMRPGKSEHARVEVVNQPRTNRSKALQRPPLLTGPRARMQSDEQSARVQTVFAEQFLDAF